MYNIFTQLKKEAISTASWKALSFAKQKLLEDHSVELKRLQSGKAGSRPGQEGEVSWQTCTWGAESQWTPRYRPCLQRISRPAYFFLPQVERFLRGDSLVLTGTVSWSLLSLGPFIEQVHPGLWVSAGNSQADTRFCPTAPFLGCCWPITDSQPARPASQAGSTLRYHSCSRAPRGPGWNWSHPRAMFSLPRADLRTSLSWKRNPPNHGNRQPDLGSASRQQNLRPGVEEMETGALFLQGNWRGDPLFARQWQESIQHAPFWSYIQKGFLPYVSPKHLKLKLQCKTVKGSQWIEEATVLSHVPSAAKTELIFPLGNCGPPWLHVGAGVLIPAPFPGPSLSRMVPALSQASRVLPLASVPGAVGGWASWCPGYWDAVHLSVAILTPTQREYSLQRIQQIKRSSKARDETKTGPWWHMRTLEKARL